MVNGAAEEPVVAPLLQWHVRLPSLVFADSHGRSAVCPQQLTCNVSVQHAVLQRLTLQFLSRSSPFDPPEVTASYPDVHPCLLGTDTLPWSTLDLFSVLRCGDNRGWRYWIAPQDVSPRPRDYPLQLFRRQHRGCRRSSRPLCVSHQSTVAFCRAAARRSLVGRAAKLVYRAFMEHRIKSLRSHFPAVHCRTIPSSSAMSYIRLGLDRHTNE